VVPWLARNWIAFDRPTPISTNQGGLLAGANCPRAYYGEFVGTWGCFPQAPRSWGHNESIVSGRLQHRALRYVGRHPGRVPAVAGVRLLRSWELWQPGHFSAFEALIADRDAGLNRKAQFCFWAVALLALAGLVILRRRRDPVRLLAAPLVLVSVVSMATYGSTRFRAAAEPALVVLAAVALEAAAGRALESVRRGPASDRVRLVRRRTAS
jgi:MYXO-CTERM domain-containing protein